MRVFGLVLVAAIVGAAVYYWLTLAPVPVAVGGLEAPLDLPEQRAEFTLIQRTSVDLPGSGGRVRCHISDITRDQVVLSVHHRDGRTLAAPRSVREGAVVAFTVGTQRYSLEVLAFKTRLVGNDEAILLLSEGVSERARIETLLTAIAGSRVVFVRNGKDHDAAGAAKHLRRKWDAARDRIQTVDQFIDHIASRSSTTGRAYTVRIEDGTEIDCATWLRQQLAE